MFRKITLHLARSPQYPEGSAHHGYEIIAPVDQSGYLDPTAWRDARARCSVRRFWAGEPDRLGHLTHRAGGLDGATWLIDYDPTSKDDDEPGYRLNTHRMIEGEYVSIQDESDALHTFRIIQVAKV